MASTKEAPNPVADHDFVVVDMTEIPPKARGRGNLSEANRALLDGEVIWERGKPKSASSRAQLAKRNGKRARYRRGERNGEDGTFFWFENREES